MSAKQKDNAELLEGLSRSYKATKKRKHWGHESGPGSRLLRLLSDLNQVAGSLVAGGVVANRFRKPIVRGGRLAASSPFTATSIAGGITALSYSMWKTIKQTFVDVLGDVPELVVGAAVKDLNDYATYWLGYDVPPDVAPEYDNQVNAYNAHYVEAARRGVLPIKYRADALFNTPLHEFEYGRHILAGMAYTSAMVFKLADEGKKYIHLHNKGAITQAVGVIKNWYDDYVADSEFDSGYWPDNDDDVPLLDDDGDMMFHGALAMDERAKLIGQSKYFVQNVAQKSFATQIKYAERTGELLYELKREYDQAIADAAGDDLRRYQLDAQYDNERQTLIAERMQTQPN